MSEQEQGFHLLTLKNGEIVVGTRGGDRLHSWAALYLNGYYGVVHDDDVAAATPIKARPRKESN